VALICLIFLPAMRCLYGEGEWESCGNLEGGAINVLAINPQNPEILYAGTGLRGVFRSLDGGETWVPAYNGLPNIPINFLVINPQNPQIVYARTAQDGIFKSDDGGASWDAVNNGLSRLNTKALAIDPQNPEILYVAMSNGENFRTTDGGESWSAMNSCPVGTRIQALAINPQNPEILYATTEFDAMGILKSTNHGESWDYVNNGLSVMNVTALTIDPQNPEILYACTDSGAYYPEYPLGIFKSTNGGETWSEVTNGLQAQSPTALAIDPKNPLVLYVGTLYGSVYKSSDGGESWNFSWSPYSTISSLAIDPLSPEIVYAATTSGGVFKSVNGGFNWSAVNAGLNAVYIRALAVDPQNEVTVYAGTGSGIFKSTDACKSWIAINNGTSLSTISIYALTIDPQRPETIYAGAFDAFKSTDAGESWSQLSLQLRLLANVGIYALAINPQNTEHLYAGSSGKYPFWESLNGGASWHSLNYDSDLNFGGIKISALAIDPQNPQRIYVGTDDSGLYRSGNGGGSVARIRSGPAEVRALAINPHNPETVYVAGLGAGVYKTTNGWDFSAANNGITELDATSLAIHPQSPSIVYAGTNGGGVFRSVDGGANWGGMNVGLTDANVQTLAMSPTMPRRLYASTSEGHLWAYQLPALSNITIRTNPAGLSFMVDGVEFATSQSFSWEPGSSHTISVVVPPASGGTRYVFANWSDGGASSHTIIVPAESTTYTANFTTQYRLTTSISPLGGGSVIAIPVSADGYYASGSTVQLSATANSGYYFLAWSGDVTGTTNPQTIIMSAPRNVNATFRRVNTIPSRLPSNHPRRPSIHQNPKDPRELPRTKSRSIDW